jgi:acyl carrier protein
MVPAVIVAMDEFPLSPNGKLDRKALPAPAIQSAQSIYAEPGSPVEKQLAAMWAELLGTERVGIHDDFFALGGHSLVAMQLVSRIMMTMKIELPLDALFNTPTIAGLARRIEEGTGQPPDNDPGTIQSISRSARRTRRTR